MIRTFKRMLTLIWLAVALVRTAHAQTVIQVIYENGFLNADKTVYTFEIRALRGAGYDVTDINASNWQFMNLRSDIQVPAGVSIQSTTLSLDHTFVSDGAISTSAPNPPGGPPPGTKAFSVNMFRINEQEIPEIGGALFGTGTLTFSGPVLASNTVTIRPYNGLTSGAFWTNLDGTTPRRPIDGTSNLPLPVKLVNFDVRKEGGTAQLAWSTSEESNSAYFEVQRSPDGKKWQPVTTVPAKGESKVLEHYEAIDENPLNGINLYRLKMVDKDGTSALSRIHKIDFHPQVQYALFPNPVSDLLSLQTADDWKQIDKVEIFNINGTKVYSSPLNPGKQINIKSLPVGTYVVKLTRKDTQVSDHRIVIAR
ncbi:T9SS type A sorting domain-containing protein [Dyadobacter sp. MSC1_007]|jgi:hypothetical protein|uniref:T9SS type A sorting domain-containing protein n=1 Tax=Dyadobacter sp. MSC1_007 TaxID=2909264 RepID=UPI00203094FE|nr:T9SS type A sorting domain-containing protein [Dyadobacter sp. MSC1_007]